MTNLRRKFASIIGLTLLVLLLPSLAFASDWPQFDYNMQHDGVNNEEQIINLSNVNTLVQHYQVTLPDKADGAPVYLSGVATASGSKDLLFLTLSHDNDTSRIIALDANSGAQAWVSRVYTGPRYTTSSPAIDPNHQYVYSYQVDGKVHKYQVGNGTEITGGGWPEVTTLKPDVEKGSSAITLATDRAGVSRLYMANGGYPGDGGDYQGHITTIDLATGAQRVFNATCSNLTVHFVENGSPGTNDCQYVQTAIWARPSVIYDPDTDKIYMATGNGTFSTALSSHSWADTTFSLNADGTGANGNPLDTYTPTNWQQLDQQDADLGSTNPVIMPVPAGSNYPHLAVQGGKDAKLRLINLDNLSGQGGPGHTGGELQLINIPQGGGLLPSPAAWRNPADGSSWLFVANYSGIAGLQLVVNSGQPSLVSRWQHGPGGSSPIIANGVLYYASSGAVKALNPITGAEVWSGNSGGLHWESPIVVNGNLYISDESGHLTAFSLGCSDSFPDVLPSNLFYGDIHYLVCQQVVSGFSDGKFRPSATTSRGQFAKIATLAFNIPAFTPTSGQTFPDVSRSNAFFNYIEAAAHAGVINGYSDGSFKPNNNIRRDELAAIVQRARGYANYTPSQPTYRDVPTGSFAYAAVETLNHLGIISGAACSSGSGQCYRPSAPIRRDELSKVTHRAMVTLP